jgi:phosphoglycolate phosphatase
LTLPAGVARPRAIIFDWDNTLVDNWGAICAALNATFRAFGKPAWTLEETKARVRQSLRDSFPGMFGERWQEARDIFYRHFGTDHLTTLEALPGAADLLAELARAGFYLGVVSNKNGTALRREADHLGWSKYFGKVVGATDAKRDKPAPDPVVMALEPAALSAESTVWFVGDTGIDMECAYAAGCVPVLVTPKEIDFSEFQAFPPKIAVPDLKRLGVLLRPL